MGSFQPLAGGGGFATDTFKGVLDGLLQGHQLALQMQAQKRADAEFKTQQAMKEQQMSMQDIMNRQVLGQTARPVSDMGTVTSQGLSVTPEVNVPASPGNDPSNGRPAMPATPAMSLPAAVSPTIQQPSYTRKADPSRVVKYGGTSYELKTPEEQQQRELAQQTSGMEALQAAKDRAAMNSALALHANQLKLEGGGTPAQGLAAMGVPDGTMLTRDELAHYTQGLLAHIQSQQATRKAGRVILGPGQTLYDDGDEPTAAIPGQQPTAAAPGMETPANPTPTTPALANNPTVQRMRAIASGGSANPTGEYAEFKGTFLPGYYQEKGITNPQPKDEAAALAEFRRQKAEAGVTETDLALRAAKGDATAEEALKRLDRSKRESRPVNTFNVAVPGLGAGTASAAQPQLTGEDFMATLPPGTAAQVRAIANGSAKMPPLGARGASAPLRDAVFRFDPSYTDQRAEVRKAFTTGIDGRNIRNLNTATVHLDQMAEAAKAMQNGTWQPGNELYNYIATKLGGAAPTNYTAVMNAFAGEAANALKGSATDPEIAHVMSTLGQNQSPQQAAGVVNQNLHILATKLKTYQDSYQQQIPNDTVYSPVLPSAKAVFQKYGMTDVGAPGGQQGGGRGAPVGARQQGGMVNMKAPDGTVKAVPADQVAHYKSLGAIEVR